MKGRRPDRSLGAKGLADDLHRAIVVGGVAIGYRTARGPNYGDRSLAIQRASKGQFIQWHRNF